MGRHGCLVGRRGDMKGRSEDSHDAHEERGWRRHGKRGEMEGEKGRREEGRLRLSNYSKPILGRKKCSSFPFIFLGLRSLASEVVPKVLLYAFKVERT